METEMSLEQFAINIAVKFILIQKMIRHYIDIGIIETHTDPEEQN